MNLFKIIIQILILVAIAALLIMIPRWFDIDLFNKGGEAQVSNVFSDQTSYYAVFLSNGQVYFGHILTKDNFEIGMRDVYYLSSGGTSSQLSLVKLGSEVHGPTNELFINKDQVLFYEKLRDDSKMVESIKSYKP